jgi:catechol 2,3-dioxygenase-like lactoylglutathione lyase family enzyme
MAKVSGLGHFGIFVQDMPKMVDFYSGVLGLTVTDRGPNDRVVFLSGHPETEHHEIALARSEDQKTDAGQVSFHIDTLPDLKVMHQRIADYGCTIDRVVNHGIAFGCYFRDPEDNRIEVYWSTGLDYPQPYADPIDLTLSEEELMKLIEDLEPRSGTGPHYYGEDVGKRLPREAAKA